MMYEILINKVDGSSVKEAFTAVSDKKAIQRVSSALKRHANQSANRSYRMIDANRREVVRETDLLKRTA